MCSEVGPAGAWQRLFNHDASRARARLSAPTVTGVAFPAVGLSQAWNDEAAGVLTATLYAPGPGSGSPPAASAAATTEFRVTLVPTRAPTVRCNGAPHGDALWRQDPATGDVIVTAALPPAGAQLEFQIFTGYVRSGAGEPEAFEPVTVTSEPVAAPAKSKSPARL
jgi:hypothetical protein